MPYIQAQRIEKKIQITWVDNIENAISEDEHLTILHFDGAIQAKDFPTLPSYYEKIAVAQFYTQYDISVTAVEYEPLSAADAALVPDDFQKRELEVNAVSAYEKGEPFLLLTFIPIVKSGDGAFRRITSATIVLEGRAPKSAKAEKGYAAQSVLASGQWYNFSLSETGIYKVTYNDLVAMGMSTPISSSQIALFGNGGKMLPEANSAPRADDLTELPIMVVDGGDGQINDGDYFLFYGQSPHTWAYDTAAQRFSHRINIYSDASWYFVTATPGVGSKKRVATVDGGALTPNYTVDEYTHYDFYEEDLNIFGETGTIWFGDLFDVTTLRTYTFSVPGVKPKSARLSVAGAGASSVVSSMSVKVNNIPVGSFTFPSITSISSATFASGDFRFTPGNSNIVVTLEYNKPATSSSAYLNWIELEATCQLSMHSPQFPFCNPSTVGAGRVTRFNIANAGSGTMVWDVTNPGETRRYSLVQANGQYGFSAPTDTLRYFFAFNGSSYLSVTPGSSVANQNLHATGSVDMVIVTHSKFLTQANELAKFREQNSGLSVKVVTIEQVYNEFSSGSMDPMAIRDYVKMIYDRSNKQYPKYLLLVGRPCYDYRGRVSGTEIYVPNYQCTPIDAIRESRFYSNDDTFGLLDDEEGGTLDGLYDIAVGRFPCTTVSQAKIAVEKSILYTRKVNLLSEGSTQISNFGDWRNMMAFVADDEEYNDFISNADNFTSIVSSYNPNINFDKIYLDAFPQVSNAGGQRYPEVTTAINNRMNRGSLFFTYIGHSGKDGWAAERILEISDINRWTNKYNMPAMLTLSCTFGFYDRPTLSPGDLVLFNSKGGGSAILTASREAWSSANNAYGRRIFNTIFTTPDGHYPTIGDIMRIAKNNSGGSHNVELMMFVLLGDPSMPLAIPTYNIVTDSINHHPAGTANDTVRALSLMTVSGRVVDANGQTLTNFNGSVYPSVYDKAVTVTTLSNDPSSPAFDFSQQKSILFKGNNTVKDGHFTFSFYVPKDIDYSFGNGKISYYACSQNEDGAGSFTNFIIGGTDTSGVDDKEGPVIELYLNDEQFVNGGIVNPDPVLIAKIRDNYGINTTGNGIGHDLTAILDDATESPIVLNDYYQTDKDSFNAGTVRYNLSDLSVGQHTITVRAWDINNNHSESQLTFEVLSDEKLKLSHVLNYPNPFTTHTDFYFEHNQGGGLFDIQVQIYTISGKLVKSITTSQYLEGNRSAAIPWDGLDDYGDKIGKGVYMYKLRVRNSQNQTAEVIEKLVIL